MWWCSNTILAYMIIQNCGIHGAPKGEITKKLTELLRNADVSWECVPIYNFLQDIKKAWTMIYFCEGQFWAPFTENRVGAPWWSRFVNITAGILRLQVNWMFVVTFSDSQTIHIWTIFCYWFLFMITKIYKYPIKTLVGAP